jgi:hypothetical protein
VWFVVYRLYDQIAREDYIGLSRWTALVPPSDPQVPTKQQQRKKERKKKIFLQTFKSVECKEDADGN